MTYGIHESQANQKKHYGQYYGGGKSGDRYHFNNGWRSHILNNVGAKKAEVINKAVDGDFEFVLSYVKSQSWCRQPVTFARSIIKEAQKIGKVKNYRISVLSDGKKYVCCPTIEMFYKGGKMQARIGFCPMW